MTKFKLAVVVGSNRRQSLNRRLAEALAALAEEEFDSTFVQIDHLPLYNQDAEAPLPKTVTRFKADVAAADALLFVT